MKQRRESFDDREERKSIDTNVLDLTRSELCSIIFQPLLVRYNYIIRTLT